MKTDGGAVYVLAHFRALQTHENSIAFTAECTQDSDNEFCRFSQFAVARIGLLVTSRFGIEKNRPDDRFHVAADTLVVVVEYIRHATHVGRTGIACHQVLNQLSADKRTDVWVIEYVVNGVAQILFRRLPCGKHDTVKQHFRISVMITFAVTICPR